MSIAAGKEAIVEVGVSAVGSGVVEIAVSDGIGVGVGDGSAVGEGAVEEDS